jgi:DNA polymerase-3 subunit epsilon
MVCTLSIARQKFPGAKHSLDALCTRFGVDRSLRIKHGALIDAQLLAQVYVELTGGRQIGLGLVAEVIGPEATRPAQTPVPGSDMIVETIRPPRPHSATDEELQRHAAFLATISDPIWNRLDSRS